MQKRTTALILIPLLAACGRQSPDDLAAKAVSDMSKGDYISALSCYNEAVDQLRVSKGDLGRMLQRRAWTYVLANQPARAISDLEEAAKLGDANKMYLWCAYISERTKDEEKALSYYNTALSKEPFFEGFLFRADIKYRHGDYADALSDYKEALNADIDSIGNGGRDILKVEGKTSPYAIHAYYGLAMCREKLSMRKSKEDFEQVIKFANNYLKDPPVQPSVSTSMPLVPDRHPEYEQNAMGMVLFYKGMAEKQLGLIQKSETDLVLSRQTDYLPNIFEKEKEKN